MCGQEMHSQLVLKKKKKKSVLKTHDRSASL